MSYKLSLLLLGLSVSLVLGFNRQTSSKTDQKIRQLHSNTMVLAETHQETSSNCFGFYNPILNQVTAQYQTEYDACIAAYQKSSSDVQSCYQNTRIQMETNSYNACRSLSSCNTKSNAYNAFECAAASASDDAKIFWEISANATEAAEKIKADYRKVDTTKTICINEAERTYVEDTSNVYSQLNSCLLGNQMIGPPTPPTADPYTSTAISHPPTVGTPTPDSEYDTTSA